MPFVDIERDIERRVIKGLRNVFELDDEFIYNDNDDLTGVVITPDFPILEAPFKQPHIVVTNIGYQHNTEFSMSNNYHSDYSANGIVNYGSNHVTQMPYSMSLVCLGEYDVSRNLANRLFYYISFRAYEYFNGNLKLNIRNVAKSPTGPREQYPEKIFQTSIDIQGVTMYMVTKTPLNYLEKNRPVTKDLLGQPFTKVDTNISHE